LVDYFVSEFGVITFMSKDGGTETLVPYHNITWHHNPEDLNLNLHCYENLKSCTSFASYLSFRICH